MDADHDGLFGEAFSDDNLNIDEEELGFDDDIEASSGPPANLVVEGLSAIPSKEGDEPVADIPIEIDALLEPGESTNVEDVTIDEPVIIAPL